MILSDVIKYNLFKRLIVEKEFKNNFSKFILETQQMEEENKGGSKVLLQKILSKLTNPSKIYEILQNEEMKKVFDKVSYALEERKVLVNGEPVNEETKYFILLGVVLYYIFSLKEGIDSVDSPFMEKAVEYLKGVAVSRVIVKDVSINTDKVNEAFEKASGNIRLFGLMVYALLILISEYVKSGDVKSGAGKVIYKLINTLGESGESFIMGIYYVLLSLKDFGGKSIYTDLIADDVYNNCFAVGLTSVPIYIMKTKYTQMNEPSNNTNQTVKSSELETEELQQ